MLPSTSPLQTPRPNAVGALRGARRLVGAIGRVALLLGVVGAQVTRAQGGRAGAPATTSTPAPPAAPARPTVTEPRQASFVSSRLNNKPLPVTDRASDDKGVQYLIEFDELILTILPRHEFRASLRYRQTLASKGKAMGRDPIQKMNVYGTWQSSGNNIRFVPDPKRGGEGLRILDGTFGADRIQVPFDYRNGSVKRRADVLLILDKNIF